MSKQLDALEDGFERFDEELGEDIERDLEKIDKELAGELNEKLDSTVEKELEKEFVNIEEEPVEKDDYFINYKLAKLTLAKMAIQFYDYELSLSDAEKYGIKYNKYSSEKGRIKCCFHRFDQSGLYIWNTLGIDPKKKPIVAYAELLDITERISREKKVLLDDSKYYEDYLEMCTTIISTIKEFYGNKMSVEEAKENNIIYTKDDVLDKEVDIFNNMCESCGESAWHLFNFEDSIIPASTLYKKKEEITDKLLELAYKK